MCLSASIASCTECLSHGPQCAWCFKEVGNTQQRVCLSLHSKRKEGEKTPVTDVKVFLDDTHQSFDATHTREYNVHV